MRSSAAVVLVLSILVPSMAFAGTVSPWMSAHGSMATYGMSDVNDAIGTINAGLGSGLEMKEVKNGFGVGGAFGLELPSRFSIGVGYDRLLASSDVSDGSTEFNLPANAFRAMAQYSFAGIGTSGAYIGASAGMILAAGSMTELGVTSDVEGSAPMFEMFTGGDWWAGPQFALTGSAGYRYAKIGEFKVGGDTAYLTNNEKATIDYSGIFARAGVKFALMK